ncbi:MAG: hypothetical protein ACHQQR_01265 [Gemmatimonadales bacterium]
MLLLALSAAASAQRPDSLQAAQRRDSLQAAQRRDTMGTKLTAETVAAPPITPRRAFLYSLAVPGLGQTVLDRRITGAAFFLVEALSLSLAHRSANDLRTARAFQGDSVPLRYVVDPATGLAQRDALGQPVVSTWQQSPYTAALVQARKLQVEDWVAVVIFNHLFAGADAFVAAQLWDFPQHVELRAYPVPGGAGLKLNVAFR